MTDGRPANVTPEDLDREVPVTYGRESFVSPEYLEAEKQLLWPKIWQLVERETDLPNPGDWMNYNVADESVIVLRKDDGSLKAFHNVCPHRGRQLISVPDMVPDAVTSVKGAQPVHDVRGNNRKNSSAGSTAGPSTSTATTPTSSTTRTGTAP